MITPSQMTALIVDDNEYARSVLSATLSELGITKVVEAEDGASAFGLATLQSFNFILLDWYMPEVNGAGLVRLLRGAKIDTPVIIATAYGTRTNLARMQELRLSNILVKPFDAKKLSKAISQAVRQTEWAQEDLEDLDNVDNDDLDNVDDLEDPNSDEDDGSIYV